MKALVVYESMFGNTEAVARAVAEGLSAVVPTELVEVGRATPSPGPDVALVVVGGPTHAFSMSRVSTRTDAVRRGATRGTAEFGLREWLEGLPQSRRHARLATFDTRVDRSRRLTGSAARSAARLARRHGFSRAGEPESFLVADTAGPLLDGELERAAAWGRSLAGGLVPAT